MKTLTPYGKILVELADQALALCDFYQRKIIDKSDNDPDDDWTSFYVPREDIEVIAAQIAEITRICRSLSTEILVEAQK
ncbi:MAG: hypothetical protein WBA66_02775 [Xanthobacteraceae bacterium]